VTETPTRGAGEWELEYRSRRTPRIAVVVAVVVIAGHVVIGALLRASDTGVTFRLSDQIGFGLIGVVIGAAILTFTRPRIRAGAQGVEIRNLVGEKRFEWDLVEGIWYPDKGRWARLELPDYENVPVMAIQASDGQLAVDAMERFREIHARHRADAPS
jgi:hypothetical protein